MHLPARAASTRAAAGEHEDAEEAGDQPHVPVLLEQVLSFFRGRKLGVYVDATLGAGGHASAVLREHPVSLPRGRSPSRGTAITYSLPVPFPVPSLTNCHRTPSAFRRLFSDASSGARYFHRNRPGPHRPHPRGALRFFCLLQGILSRRRQIYLSGPPGALIYPSRRPSAPLPQAERVRSSAAASTSVHLVRSNFRGYASAVRSVGPHLDEGRVDGALFDLGMSSMQARGCYLLSSHSSLLSAGLTSRDLVGAGLLL